MNYRIPVVAVVMLVALVAACDSGAPGTMVSIRPPVVWEQSLAAQRAAKDEAFRTSPETPLLAEDVASFTGLQYWQPDARYYYVGPIKVDSHRMQFEIVTTSGQSRPCEKFGSVAFPIDGVLRELEVYRLLDQGGGMRAEDLLLPFTDGTTGTETYPSGRYIDLEGPPGEMHIVAGPDGRPVAVGPFVLDFNRAYNPSCAYGAPERFACPVTPKANRLSMRIEAGERGFKPREGAEGRVIPELAVVRNDRPFFLIGFMGSGKSAVGHLVADRLGRDFVDTDDLVVEREGRPIERIFREAGEAEFRRLEWEALQTLAGRRQCVVATGGGLFLGFLQRCWLREHGTTVWLDAPFSACLRRVGTGAGRPLWAAGKDPEAFRALFEKRRAVYALAAVRVGAAGTADETARGVLSRLGAISP